MATVNHSGHRARMKEHLDKVGMEGLRDYEVLEMMIYESIPRKNTSDIAHLLLETFGSFDAVLDAEISDLMTVEGVGLDTARRIKFYRDVSKRYYMSMDVKKTKVLYSSSDVCRFARPFFYGRKREALLIVLLDLANRVKYAGIMFEGSVDEVVMHTREIVNLALKHNAYYVIISHNHPLGHCVPSPSDVATTKQLRHLLSNVELELIDHVIVHDNMCNSFAEHNFFKK